jgi:hypothetical protein
MWPENPARRITTPEAGLPAIVGETILAARTADVRPLAAAELT